MSKSPTRLTAAAFGLLLSVTVAASASEVVVVVSARSPLHSLTRDQLVDIYLGRSSRLPDGEMVVPIDQAERSPAYEDFYQEYVGRTAAQMKAHWSKLVFTGRGRPPRSVDGGRAVADFVANNHSAIGYLSPELVDDRLRVVAVEP